MKSKTKTSLFLVTLTILVLSLSLPAAADDNEIFGVVEQDVEPNILLIIDNSGSMGSEMTIDGECCESWNCDGDWECTERNFWGNCVSRECSGEKECESWYDCEKETTRMAVTKDTAGNIVDKYAEGNRFGLMTFHNSQGGYIVSYDGKDAGCSVKDEFILDDSGELKESSEYDEAIENYKQYLKDAVDSLEADGSTPLAETLFEAGRYFAGESSAFNSGSYDDTSAIKYRCAENYVVLLSDGKPQLDHHIDGKSINGHELTDSQDYTAEGSDDYRYYYDTDEPELQDVAKLLHDNDINGHFDGEEYTQNITTYTIGFSSGVEEKAQELLQDTADTGSGTNNTAYEDDGGLFFYATDQVQLSQAFETIMANIKEKSTSFTSPTVPVHDVNNAYSGDYGYMSMFKPLTEQSRWQGNIKKYRLSDDQEFTSCCGDPPCEPILNDQGAIKNSAKSCWTIGDDGSKVTDGGAGEVLSGRDTERNIYSNIQEETPLSNDDNEFAEDNSNLTPGDFGVDTESEMQEIISEIRMEDKDWRLGDFNHSKPAITSYDTGRYIFAGSNDGMLHCFDDSNGEEKWAFVPRQQFDRLQQVYTGSHSYFMDGSPTIADSSNTKVLICGERRGGSNYYALDISNIDAPEYLYTRSVSGQSWKQPQFVNFPTAEESSTESFLLTGGYDSDYDESAPDNPDGNSLIVIGATNNNLVKEFDQNTIDTMEHSIVSVFAADMVDDGEDVVSHMYAGDMGGNMFAFRDNETNGDWQSMRLFHDSGKKIFEEADIVPEYVEYWDSEEETWVEVVGEYVFFGTGDRANPLDTNATNYFYCVKNDWHTGNLTRSSQVGEFNTLHSEDDTKNAMLDVTDNLIQEGDQEEQELVQEELNKKYNRGWYIELEDNGEKCLSTPTVINGVVYFTTFAPTEGAESDDPCDSSSDMGTARLYALDYKTGGAVYDDFDGDPDDELGKDDRSTEIQAENITISPDPKPLIDEDDTTITTGPETHETNAPSGAQIFYWKQK